MKEFLTNDKVLRSDNYIYEIDKINEAVISFDEFKNMTTYIGDLKYQIEQLIKGEQYKLEDETNYLYTQRNVMIKIYYNQLIGKHYIVTPRNNIIKINQLIFFNDHNEELLINSNEINQYVKIYDGGIFEIKKRDSKFINLKIIYEAYAIINEYLINTIVTRVYKKLDNINFYNE